MTSGGTGRDDQQDARRRLTDAMAATMAEAGGLTAEAGRLLGEIDIALSITRTTLDDELAAQRRRLRREKEEAEAKLQADAVRRTRAVGASLRAAAEELAPGAAGAGWAARALSVPQPARAVPSAVRVGTLPGGAPALLPLIGVSGWVVGGSGAEQLIADTVLRLALSAPPESLRVSVFDPRLRGILGFTSLFRDTDPIGYPPAIQTEDGLRRLLSGLIDRIGRAAESMSTAGAADHRDLPLSQAGRLELAVLLDAPSGVTETAADDLNRIVESAAGRGVFLLIASPGYVDGPIRVGDRAQVDVDRGLVRVDAAGEIRSDSFAAVPGLTVRADPSPTPAARNNLIHARAEAIEAAAQGTMTLEAVLAEIDAGWSDRGDDGLSGIFARMPGGLGGLELRSANPPAPNALIGGAVGTGKSNLLLCLIYGLASRYSPRDVRFHLLDFKEGVEFARLAPIGDETWLPHVDSLGLESDRAYGVAVLEHLASEFDRRADAFKSAGASSLADYRALTGRDMPRLVLVADEFQVLFEPDDDVAQRAVQLIEHLARKGRAYGVHLVLASQTLSGIQALALKRDAIFGQFHNRISLRNTEHESETILGAGNLAAGDLHGRGQAVFNDDLGHLAANRIGSVVWADPAYLDRLQTELFSRAMADGFTPRRPSTFVSSAYAEWIPADDREIATVGVPISVGGTAQGFSLKRGRLGNVALIGDDLDRTRAVLSSIHASIRASDLASAQWTVIDSSGVGLDDVGPWANEAGIQRISAEEADSFLRTLTARTAVPSSRIERVIILDDPDDIASLVDSDEYPRPIEAVERFIKRSIACGMLFVIRFRSMSSYDARTAGELRDGFRTIVLTEPGSQTDLLAPGTGRMDFSGPRVVVVDRSSGRQDLLVPFDPAALPQNGIEKTEVSIPI